jgi:hypothetical protein
LHEAAGKQVSGVPSQRLEQQSFADAQLAPSLAQTGSQEAPFELGTHAPRQQSAVAEQLTPGPRQIGGGATQRRPVPTGLQMDPAQQGSP